MTFTGTFRVYFNRHQAAPFVWCVATDQWELAVSEVRFVGYAQAVYAAKPTADDEDGKPSAWLSAEGNLTVYDSIATIDCRHGASW